jgi:hypothetical protein
MTMKRTFKGDYPRRQAFQINGQTVFCFPFEAEILKELAAQNIAFAYESQTIPYERPARKTYYKPDILLPNGIIVEVKGEFPTADRQKHKLIKQQHPDLDIRFVFQNPRRRISKQSKTTYAMWCETHGFPYADKHIPPDWLK